ncbi:MAG TPA: ImmA/IrrE family metallo-endopeptidase [Pyrinomonadaceae bacterium]|jgi:hypothetical protein|nr:ImmA/IrrE family metallo-endopeptidase [Pyrinomonadaceae bacterium]
MPENIGEESEILPPSQKGRRYEIQAMAIREFAGLLFDEQPLDPFALARYAHLLVLDIEDVKGLSEGAKSHLLGAGRNDWSGGAASKPLPDGRKLIILNPTHSKKRQHATLMEEICHVFLGHKPTQLMVKTSEGGIRTREYQAEIEEEAYATGAAALVPYSALKRMVANGLKPDEIARHFRVSRQLVEYRMKVSRLWRNNQE